MPNPFIRTGVPNYGAHQPTDRPEPIAPHPEAVHGHNNAYRGTEDHGVPSTHDWDGDAPDYADTKDAEFHLVPPPEEHVIPVRIVTNQDAKASRVVMRSRQTQLTVGNPPAVLVGRNDARRKVTVKATSTTLGDVLYVGGSVDQATPLQGYAMHLSLGANQLIAERDFAVQGMLFGQIAGASAGGTVITVWIYEEVAIDL